MTVMETETGTVFTVQPFATVPVDGDAADLNGEVLAALERDGRPIAPVVDYDYETGQLTALFQVELPSQAGHAFNGRTAQLAAAMGLAIFDMALERTGVMPQVSGVSIVEGDDPEQLP